jgi:5-methylcytosine-specific restriction endonuclease McrA
MNEHIVKKIKEYKWSQPKVYINKRWYDTAEVMLALVEHVNFNVACQFFNCNRNTLAKSFNSLPEFEPNKKSAKTRILGLLGITQCSNCKEIKPPEEFYSVGRPCKECSKKRMADVYAENREYYRSLQEQYHKQEANQGIIRENKARRRLTIANVSSDDPEIRKQLQEIYANRPDGYHVDHIIPLSKGGLHHPDNLQYLTAEENLKKGSKIPENNS